jgi:hypothetical protein
MREIQSMYDVSFAKLSERFFKGQPWPSVDAIAELVDHDHVFCMLYKVSRVVLASLGGVVTMCPPKMVVGWSLTSGPLLYPNLTGVDSLVEFIAQAFQSRCVTPA